MVSWAGPVQLSGLNLSSSAGGGLSIIGRLRCIAIRSIYGDLAAGCCVWRRWGDLFAVSLSA